MKSNQGGSEFTTGNSAVQTDYKIESPIINNNPNEYEGLLIEKIIAQLSSDSYSQEFKNKMDIIGKADLFVILTDYIRKIPKEDIQTLSQEGGVIQRTVVRDGKETRTNGEGVASLSLAISRQLSNTSHTEGLKHFAELDAQKYNSTLIVDYSKSPAVFVADAMKRNAENLNYDKRFLPITIGGFFPEEFPVGVNEKVVTNLAAGMLAKIVGQNNDAKGPSISLPEAVVKAVFNAAIKLSKNPRIASLDEAAQLEKGKQIGKVVRDDLSKEQTAEYLTQTITEKAEKLEARKSWREKTITDRKDVSPLSAEGKNPMGAGAAR